jgi:hypothetical protein
MLDVGLIQNAFLRSIIDGNEETSKIFDGELLYCAQ